MPRLRRKSAFLRTLFAAFALMVAGFPIQGMAAPIQAPASFAGSPPETGNWGNLITAELVPIHVIYLPNGKIMYWDRHDQGTHDMIPRVWDPVANTTIKTPSPGYDLFCAGHSFLRNGDLVVGGGHIVDFVGENKMRIYNWRTNTWDASLPQLNAGRWYPTNTTLPNGDVLMVSGDIRKDTPNDIPQVFDSRSRTLRTLDSAKQALVWYPFMFVAGRDRVFMAGPDSMTRFLDTRGRGRWTPVGLTRSGALRTYGTSVMYLPGKVMISGGGTQPPRRSVETIDLNAATPAWAYSDSMQYGRRHHTSVIMPDGNVMVAGGTSGPGENNSTGAVYHPEMWNPSTGKWTTWAPAKTMRIYHSFALLLPDARILTGGGGHPGPESNYLEAHPDFEIFEPPYLFKGPRPIIDQAPDTLYYGKPFTVSSKTGGTVQVNLLRIPAVTHAFDQNQNFNRLAVQRQNATTLSVTPPADSILTAPGPHHLFLLDSLGIPSVAKLVWVESPSPANAVLPREPALRRIGLVEERGMLRVIGRNPADLGKGRILDLRGHDRGELEAAPGVGYRLPEGLGNGVYMVRIDVRSQVHTGTFCHHSK